MNLMQVTTMYTHQDLVNEYLSHVSMVITPMRCSNDTGVLTGTSKIHNRILLFTHLSSLALISSTVSQANLASLDCGPNFLEASTAALMAF